MFQHTLSIWEEVVTTNYTVGSFSQEVVRSRKSKWNNEPDTKHELEREWSIKEREKEGQREKLERKETLSLEPKSILGSNHIVPKELKTV